MSKIGDLFVRLGLKTDDYKKGVKDAKKETTSFGSSLKSMKAGAIAVWAAIGATVMKVGKDMVNGTQKIGDAWARMTASVKAGWDTFIQSLSNFDFTNFAQRIQGASSAAKDLADALDAQFEGTNSVKLQKALASEELEQLRIAMMDQTKSYDERLKAAQSYITKVKPIYEQEIKLAQDLMDARVGAWVGGTNVQNNEATKKDLTNFLIAYGGNDKALTDLVNEYIKVSNQLKSSQKSNTAFKLFRDFYVDDITFTPKTDIKKLEAELAALKQRLETYGKEKGYTNSLADLGDIYNNWRGDKDTQPLVDAIAAAHAAEGAMNRETRRIQTLTTTLEAAIAAAKKAEDKKTAETLQKVADFAVQTDLESSRLLSELKQITEEWNEKTFEIEIEAPELDMSDIENELDSFIAEFTKDLEEIQQLNNMFSETIADSIAGGMQELFNALFKVEDADISQIIAALLEPFANTAIQLGTMLIAQGVAIEVFKTSLASLNGPAAIAAGAALVAAGTAMRAGMQALSKSRNPSTAVEEAYGGGSSVDYETYESNITIEVVGKISGSDIIIAGSKQLNKWNR